MCFSAIKKPTTILS